MNQRRVKSVGRPVYGRQQSIGRNPARRRRGPKFNLGFIPRRMIVMLVLVAAFLVLLNQFFAVSDVRVKAQGQEANIKAEAEKHLAAHWRQRNLLTIDTAMLEAALEEASPMVKTLEVRRNWPRGLQVNAVLKQPSLGWLSGNQAYLLDRDGSAIGVLPNGSSLPVVVDGSNLPVDLGKRVATTRFVTFVTGLAPALGEIGLQPSRYEVKESTLDLEVTTAKGYRLIMDTSRPVAESVADLKILLAFLGKQGRTPAEYIDLRIAGKAYYK